jgi:hypothetical protein
MTRNKGRRRSTKRFGTGFWNLPGVSERGQAMGFVVGSTFIIWLLVVNIAFGARPAQTVDEGQEKFRKRSINNER